MGIFEDKEENNEIDEIFRKNKEQLLDTMKEQMPNLQKEYEISEERASTLTGDIIKTILTISTAVIGLSVTFVANYQKMQHLWLLAIGWGTMVISIILSIWLKYFHRKLEILRYLHHSHVLLAYHFAFIDQTEKVKEENEKFNNIYQKEIRLAPFYNKSETLLFIVFVIGISIFLLFGILNLFVPIK